MPKWVTNNTNNWKGKQKNQKENEDMEEWGRRVKDQMSQGWQDNENYLSKSIFLLHVANTTPNRLLLNLPGQVLSMNLCGKFIQTSLE